MKKNYVSFKIYGSLKLEILFFISLFLLSSITYAQVGIGTTNPDQSAILDINGNVGNKYGGLLIPRVPLNSFSDRNSISNPVESLLVYNSNNSSTMSSGFYYWKDNKWNALTGAGNSGGEGWQLQGNSISDDDFLGSTNNKGLIFKISNRQIAKFTIGNSIALGVNATSSGARSYAIGYNAISSGDESLAMGRDAEVYGNRSMVFGYSGKVTGEDSFSFGRDSEVTSNRSFAVGYNSKVTKEDALAIGRNSSVEGNRSAAIGFYASSPGEDAYAFGREAKATGIRSTAIGFSSSATRDDSFAIGRQASATGNRSFAIGFGAIAQQEDALALGRQAQANGLNSTAIGFGAVASQNQMIFGNSNIVKIGGYQPWSNLSDGRFKYDVKENVPGLVFINKLRPITYKLDRKKLSKFKNESQLAENTQDVKTGFIAQEVEKAARELKFEFSGVQVPEDLSKDNYSLSYAEFVVPLVKAVQEQQQKIEILEKKVKEIEDLKKEISSIRSTLQHIKPKK